MSTSLSLTNAEINRAIAVVAGVNRSASSWDTAFLSDARDIIRSGLRRFYNPTNPDGSVHQWRFLERKWEDHGLVEFSTGTVTVSTGTVTLAGGTWPAWAADGILRVDGRSLYVTIRTDGTTLTIDHTGVAHAALTTFTLHRWRYGLPTDFSEFIDGVVYSKGNNQAYLLRSRLESEIRKRYAANFKTGDTSLYAVTKGQTADTSEWYFTFWPTANTDAYFSGRYRAAPEDELDNSDLTALGATVQIEAVHAETLMAAIQAAAEEFYNDAPGVHAQRFQTRLLASIQLDRHTQGPVDFSEEPGLNRRRLALLNHTPTYNDLLS